MARHHLRFKNFRQPTLDAARALFDASPWRMEDDADKREAYQTFVNAVATTYNIPTALVQVNRFVPGIEYVPAIVEVDALEQAEAVHPPRIVLPKWSILSLFYGTRVHLLANGQEPVSETDPTGWAASLFYSVKPVMFRARAREGRIHDVKPQDTYGSQTWQRMIEAGVVREDGTLVIRNFNPAMLDNADELQAAIAEATAPVPADDLIDVLLADDDAIDYDDLLDIEDEDEPDYDDAEDDAVVEVSEEAQTDNLASLNRDALRVLAAEHNIAGRGRMTRDELEQALRTAGVRG
jgi:hypothetical protein